MLPGHSTNSEISHSSNPRAILGSQDNGFDVLGPTTGSRE